MYRQLSSASACGRRAALAGFTAALLAAGRRAGAAQEVLREDVDTGGLVGALSLPRSHTGLPAVVSLGGAMGGLWEEPARALAAEGFPTLALATHNWSGRPATQRLLPVEYVLDAVALVRRRGQPTVGCVALRGWSRGGELALLAASLSPEVKAVIAYSPRCYVGREQNKPNNFDDPTAVAAFTWMGQPVEGAPLPQSMWADPAKPSLEDLHGIAVERIAGPIMLISGTADTGLAGTTPAFSCAQAIRRRALFGVAHNDVHASYPDAGHNIAGPPPFTGPVQDGGSAAGNAAAVADSWPRSLAFLRAASSVWAP